MQPTTAKALLQGLWSAAPAGVQISSVATDSRKVKPGSLFVAIWGERVNGADYAASALKDGAVFVMAQQYIEDVPADKTIVVPDVLDAMIQMGANYRSAFQPLVLGITGSVGKTTTKEFAAAIFASFGKTVKTEGNQNNEIGLPKTLFALEEDTRYAVLEMGMQGAGEIRKLALAARPDGAIITRIGMAHLEQLKSVENILAAKLEIGEGVASGGPIVMNGDDERLAGVTMPTGMRPVYAGIANEECEVRAVDITREAQGQRFQIVDARFGRLDAAIPALGRHTVQDALLAYAAATRLGLNPQQAAAALADYLPAGNRQRVEKRGGLMLVQDFYNAGPDSMKASLSTFAEMEASGRHIAVLGNMLELGTASEMEHRTLGHVVADSGVDLLITVGELAALAADEAEKRGVSTLRCTGTADAAQLLQKKAKTGDIVLLKASRGMKFEEIVERLS